jgi:hypothetical protein
VIETQISKSFFDANDLAKPFTVHWTMACANDSISVDPPASSSVPTPSILPMLALGMTLLTGFRRNSNQKIGVSVLLLYILALFQQLPIGHWPVSSILCQIYLLSALVAKLRR